MNIKTLCVAASLAVLAACASTPEPAPITQAPPPSVTTDPAPVGPVTQAPVQTLPQDSLPIPGSVDDFVYQASDDRIYFAYNQYDLSNEAREVLRRQAVWLNAYPSVKAVIAGNADERGTREYNLALGARRADSVKAYLVTQGVSPNRLTSISYGKERPIDGRSSESGWARNRNSHTNIVSGAIG